MHEGLRLEGRDGWVGIGQTLEETWRQVSLRWTNIAYFLPLYQVMVRRIDNVGKTVWTFIEGDSHGTSGQTSYSIGFAIAQVGKTGLKCNTCTVFVVWR